MGPRGLRVLSTGYTAWTRYGRLRPFIMIVITMAVISYLRIGPDRNLVWPDGEPERRKLADEQLPFATTFEQGQNQRMPLATSKTFHILLPMGDRVESLCQTLLSAIVLEYPAPNLMGTSKPLTDTKALNSNVLSRLQSVYDYIVKRADDKDLVLVVNEYNVWFQLPPEVLVTRYLTTTREVNEELEQQYGRITQENRQDPTKKEDRPRYRRTIVFGGNLACTPEDTDCVSRMQARDAGDSLGRRTDGTPDMSRSLIPEILMGPVRDMRLLYERALEEMGQMADPMEHSLVFARIFAEQEGRRASRSDTAASTRSWLLKQMKALPALRFSSITAHPHDGDDDGMEKTSEFSIGLDTAASLFLSLDEPPGSGPSRVGSNVSLPSDILTSRPPFPSNDTTTSQAKGALVPLSPLLDDLSTDIPWTSLPLVSSADVSNIPAVVRQSPTADGSLFPSLWFHEQGRALLRHRLRTPAPFLWRTVGGEEKAWDKRGGRGGVWSEEKWYGWKDVCRGMEEVVFADGKGIWGKEEGDGTTWNYWGQQITGEVSAEGKEEEMEEKEKEKAGGGNGTAQER